MKSKILKKICGVLGYKLIEKNVAKNQRYLPEFSSLNIKKVLNKLILKNKINYIIQVGANDGESFDELNYFIKEYKIKSLLIEPIKDNFEKLKKTYKNTNHVILENSALSINDEILFLYKVNPNYINNYGSHIPAIPSFYKKHLLNHGVKEKHIIKEKINPISFKKLLDKHKIQDFDLLFLDAEGYDGKIVDSFFDDSTIRPIIIFEFIHIDPAFFKTLIKKIKDKKYLLFPIEENIICFPKEKEITIDLN